jgi:hypothetical protein
MALPSTPYAGGALYQLQLQPLTSASAIDLAFVALGDAAASFVPPSSTTTTQVAINASGTVQSAVSVGVLNDTQLENGAPTVLPRGDGLLLTMSTNVAWPSFLRVAFIVEPGTTPAVAAESMPQWALTLTPANDAQPTLSVHTAASRSSSTSSHHHQGHPLSAPSSSSPLPVPVPVPLLPLPPVPLPLPEPLPSSSVPDGGSAHA